MLNNHIIVQTLNWADLANESGSDDGGTGVLVSFPGIRGSSRHRGSKGQRVIERVRRPGVVTQAGNSLTSIHNRSRPEKW